jgi:hypothetical protein
MVIALPHISSPDIELIQARRSANGGDFWSSTDGRWGVGSPYSTIACGLLLHECGIQSDDKIMRGISDLLFACQTKDGRIRPGPKLPVQPCHTANAARMLCRLGFADDPRIGLTFDHLLSTQHADGGWRCSVLKYGNGPDTDASNPGVTLFALDALRFRDDLRTGRSAERAIDTLLDHWSIRRPMGPCRFGIGSRFMAIEYPFFRYNLFFFVYVLSYFPRARASSSFRDAFAALEAKTIAGKIVVEHQNPRLKELDFCREGMPSLQATLRYEEVLANLTDR